MAVNNSSTKAFWKQPAIYLLLLVVGAGGALLGDRLLSAKQPSVSGNTVETTPTIPPAEPSAGNRSALANLPRLPLLPKAVDANFIVNAVEKVGPAVVRIDSSRRVRSRSGNDSPFPNDFFGSEPPAAPRGRVERGTGSGFLIAQDGQILTNAHVVDGADKVRVLLKDGRSFQGKVLGEDPVTDVAVVKIEATNLPTVKMGNSEQLLPGEWAIAIGNPLGLDNSVTAGIISATGRSSSDVGVPDKRIGFIQTDAAINPGNSGGPLLNANGEVIGMNTAIISGAQGLGFAIPINAAQRIAQQLIATGKVEHAYLGVEMVTLTPEVRQEITANNNLRVAADSGVFIATVVPGSPAAEAGLRAGDIIQKINSQAITRSEAVQQIVQNTPVGTPLKLEVNRNNQTLNIEVKPGNLPVQTNR